MSKTRRIIIAISIGLVIGIIAASGIFAFKVYVHGKLPPGTTVSGIDISYKTPEETKEILLSAKEKYLSTPLEITLNNTTVEMTPEELGVDILVDRTIQIIKETDATKISLLDIFNFSEKEPTTINILTKIDHEKLISKINEKFRFAKYAPKSANFYFDGGALAIKEGEKGYQIDEEKLFNDIKSSAKNLIPEKIRISISIKEPEITKEILEAQQQEIQESLNHEFALIDPIYSDDWYLKLIDHLDWVKFAEEEALVFDPFSETEAAKHIKIEIDQEKLDEYIDAEISQWLDVSPEPLNIYTDEEGEIIIEGKGNTGLEVQRTRLKKSIELAVANRIRDVPIPVRHIDPEITVSEDLRELGIKELIGVGHSSYYGSPGNRVHNIKVGASKFNGVLIEPDEIFSFNETLGPVNGATGYRMELVIKAEGTIPEYGGGLCQVSTTMYRSAIYTGLPIVVRNPHSYAVSYYSQVGGHGLDATIYLGGSDLQFKNDTGNHILIQTYTKDDYELYIAFYGTSDGRIVEMEGPYLSNYHGSGPTVYIETTDLPPGVKKQVEISHTGFNALWYRYITYADGETVVETIKSAYRAIPAKILVGAESGGGEG